MQGRFKIAFYKGNRPGLAGLYNRGVRAWTSGKYSHVELVFSDGLSASSSFEDGGVRFKLITYSSSHWDIYSLPDAWEAAARDFFVQRAYEKTPYDLLGNARFMFGLVRHSDKGLFCSEAVAKSLQLPDAWRYEPNVLDSTVRRLVAEHVAISRRKAA